MAERSKVKSERRSAAMKARWADPAFAAKSRANLEKGRVSRHQPPVGDLPAPPQEGGASASTPFTDRALFGRRRSRSS